MQHPQGEGLPGSEDGGGGVGQVEEALESGAAGIDGELADLGDEAAICFLDSLEVPLVDLPHVRPRQRSGHDPDPLVAVFAEVARGRVPGAMAVEEKDVARPIRLVDVDDRRDAAAVYTVGLLSGCDVADGYGDDPVHAARDQAADHRLGYCWRVACIGDENERSLFRSNILDATKQREIKRIEPADQHSDRVHSQRKGACVRTLYARGQDDRAD